MDSTKSETKSATNNKDDFEEEITATWGRLPIIKTKKGLLNESHPRVFQRTTLPLFRVF